MRNLEELLKRTIDHERVWGNGPLGRLLWASKKGPPSLDRPIAQWVKKKIPIVGTLNKLGYYADTLLNSSAMSSIASKGAMSSGLLTAAISSSLLFSGIAFAENVGLEAGRKIHINPNAPINVRAQNLRDLVDTAVGLTDKKANINVANQLYRTAIHESALLTQRGNLAGSSARGMFQILKGTAKDVVQRYASTRPDVMGVLKSTSGLGEAKLLSLTTDELSGLVKDNDLFAAAVARYKYKMQKTVIPEELSTQAVYWRKYYHAGKGTGTEHIRQFIQHNKQFDAQVRDSIKAQIKRSSKPKTMGIVNKVLHNNKTNHAIKDVVKKTKHLFKAFWR